MSALENLFNEAAARVKDSREIITTQCPDQYVGMVGEMMGAPKFPNRDERPFESRPEGIPCLVMILESPHKYEFSGDEAIGPANGSAGSLIRSADCWTKIFGYEDGILRYSSYGLILMNSIQYQCSLGIDTSVYRSEVFGEMWESPLVQNDFIKRLTSYLIHKDDVVVNCCTGAGAKPPLRNRVQDVIQNAIEDKEFTKIPTFLRRAHPSSWKNRYAKNEDWPYASPRTRK